MVVVGVLLVCFSSRGHTLVFNYPLESSPFSGAAPVRTNPVRPGDAHPATSGHHQALPNAPGEKRRAAQENLFGFQPQVLSDILSPKVALCDRIFKLTIDDMVFVGHPTLLNTDRPGTGHRFARQIQRKLRLQPSAELTLPIDMADNDDDEAEAEGLNEALLATPTLFDKSPGTPHLARPRAFSMGVSQSPLLPLNTTPPYVNTAPVAATGGSQNASSNNISHASQQQLSMFNLVFVVIPDDRQGDTSEVRYVYTNILAKLTAGLKYEQVKRGYIKKEIDVIMGIRDELHNGAGYFITQQAMEKILQESSLARLLAEIFHAMSSHSNDSSYHTHVDLNSSVDISILIDRHILGGSTTNKHLDDNEMQREFGSLRIGSGNGMMESSGDDYTDDSESIARYIPNHPPLRPYQTVLLLYHAEEILKSLPADSAILLHDMIEIVTPTLSLENLSIALSCSLAQIYRLVCHLVFWKKAKVIDVIQFKNKYVVSREADLSRLAHLDTELNVRVKNLDLGKMLAELSGQPRAFSAVFKEKNMPYLEIIALFLRNNLIEQCRTVCLLKPKMEVVLCFD
ncbi:Nitrogen permease regulator 3 [Podochytrium sp. JEL0797]|nr:Nitrogen permease regulator 3 [Podochytrium sp. JEL0797]